ncbi:MAG: hypothetical protein JWR16_1063 [Nevskia sp.]|nr:hypothetical protein [Nevskia sp.]
MKYEERQEFSQPWETVKQMFSDPGYFEKKAKILQRRDVKVLEHEQKGEHFRIRFSFDETPTIELPSFAQRFAGKSAHVIEQDSWNLKTRTGKLSFELQGLPVKLSADMKVLDTDEGCVNVLSWNVSCSVPLIGGKFEKLIAQDIQFKAAADLAASRALLKKY